MTEKRTVLIYSTIAGAVAGLIGAFAGRLVFKYLPQISLSNGDALSVANTFIVYTTLIFVAISIFLAFAGIWFANHFSSSKEDHLSHISTELRNRIRENKDECAEELIEHALKSPDAIRFFQETVENRINEIFEKRIQDFASRVDSAYDALRGGIQ